MTKLSLDQALGGVSGVHVTPYGADGAIDVALLRRVEELGADGVTGEGLQHQRAHEVRGPRGERHAHLVSRAAQRAHQLGRLVGGDPARNGEQHAPVRHETPRQSQCFGG